MKAAVSLHPVSEISMLGSEQRGRWGKVSAASTAHVPESGAYRWEEQL